MSWAIALIGLLFYLPLRGTVRQIMAAEQAQQDAERTTGGHGVPLLAGPGKTLPDDITPDEPASSATAGDP